MEYAEACEAIKAFAQKKAPKKSKFYFSDLAKVIEMKPRPAKKLINKMVEDQVLELWSSGSTTMYGVKGISGKQAAAEGEA